MPFIDVTDILSDPEIAGQAFTVIRSVITVPEDGQAVATPQSFQAIGSVQPASSRDIERLPEGTMQTGNIKIRTTFRLSSGGTGVKADNVVWPAEGGATYFVQTVDDWSEFGVGYVEALASLAVVNP